MHLLTENKGVQTITYVQKCLLSHVYIKHQKQLQNAKQ